ncbi:hypothetical protein [Mesorhizobium sp. M00.F.Ca.ET.216.01.1.1]|uniref:hypothetical protein n=1 Tax=Mesorhizobium sp. M00.F.Ca.ET.216.01.1.1 TaxID=2500528 RepID=UPI001FE16AD8|nr:hypothetical protein [Mesorhizobium sp. M00.F.Ca.ET.216.01.1.1]
MAKIRLDRFVGQTILPRAPPKNFELAQRAIDPTVLLSKSVLWKAVGLPKLGRTMIGGKGEIHMAGNLISETFEVCRFAIAVLKDHKRSRAARRDFWALGPDECTGVLDDIGLSRSEFDDAMRLPYASEDLLSSAMRSIGIDPDDFNSLEAARDRFMARICITCPNRRQCHGHLDAFDFESHYQDFCPNSANFADLLRNGCST